MSRLFEAAEKSCDVILKDKQMTLECIEHGEHFSMDLDLMTDVLINLIDNGVKASDCGGKIVLRAYDNIIEVQDFGQGIPAEALIAKRHNISIQIDSKEGNGTRIILQFV